MAYTELATGTWGTGPKIPYTFYYSKRRSGKDMIYKIKVVIGAVTGYSSFGYPIKVSVNCGGQTASSQIKNASPSQWSSSITYETSDLTVANKTTGTTALSITLTGVDAPRGSTSYTYNLPIDAAMSSVSATNANIGSVSKITISKSNSSFTHTLQYSYNGTSFTNIVTKTSATTYDWTIPTDTYNQLGSKDKSKTITIKCITYSGSTEIGSQTTTITAYAVEADCKPTVSITITNNSANATLTGSADTIINNNGGVVITGAATAKYSAAITSNTISVGSDAYSENTKTFTSLPSGTIKFTATDSRGYSNTATANRTVIQYVKPTITIEKPVITTEGVATFETKGNWFNGSFGATDNTLTVQYAYGAVDGTYSAWQNATITKSGNTFSANITVSNLDYTKRYKFKTRVVDKLNTISSNEVFGQAIPIFDWGENDFQFNVPVSFSGGVTDVFQLGIADYIVEQNITSTSESNYTCYKRYRVWKSGLIENWLCVEYSKPVNIDIAWGNFYRSNYLGGQDWAKAFTTTNNLSIIGACTDSAGGNGAWIAQYGAKNTTSIPRYYLCRPSSSTATKPQVSWYACGT